MYFCDPRVRKKVLNGSEKFIGAVLDFGSQSSIIINANVIGKNLVKKMVAPGRVLYTEQLLR